MNLRLSRDAQKDIQSAYKYQASESPSATTALISDIRTAIRYIERQPRGSQKTDMPDVYAKVVKGRPYKIFYRFDAASVEIIHIRHTRLPVWEG